MKLVIIESPYAGDTERNVAYAKRCVIDCLQRSEAPIASHLLFTRTGVLNDAEPAERKLGIDAGLAWYRAADLIVFYTGLGWSNGMRAAYHECQMTFKDYEFRELPGDARFGP
jgi:hypothetical protein